MHEDIRVHLSTLGDAVQALALPADRKQAVASLLSRLPPLYAAFRETNDVRYGDEITRMLQGVMKELGASGADCPEAQRLAADLPEALRLLHERLGVPGLALKLPAPLPRPRKAPKSNEKKKRATKSGAKKETDAG